MTFTLGIRLRVGDSKLDKFRSHPRPHLRLRSGQDFLGRKAVRISYFMKSLINVLFNQSLILRIPILKAFKSIIIIMPFNNFLNKKKESSFFLLTFIYLHVYCFKDNFYTFYTNLVSVLNIKSDISSQQQWA